MPLVKCITVHVLHMILAQLSFQTPHRGLAGCLENNNSGFAFPGSLVVNDYFVVFCTVNYFFSFLFFLITKLLVIYSYIIFYSKSLVKYIT